MLSEKVIVVTGGAGLLGQAFVRAIVEAGGIAVIADIDVDLGEKLSARLKAELVCDRILFVPLDITSKESIGRLLEDMKARFSRVDALVNCAYPRGANYGRKFEDVEYEDFCRNVSLHLGGFFLASQQFALFFREQGFGNVVTLASVYGIVAPRFEIYEGTTITMPVEYAVIKSALIHLNQYMMRYFKGYPIRFNCISPGGIFDHQPERFLRHYESYAQTKGMLMPGDLTGTLVFLLSDLSEFINGQNLVVDDGWTA